MTERKWRGAATSPGRRADRIALIVVEEVEKVEAAARGALLHTRGFLCVSVRESPISYVVCGAAGMRQ